ncbi:helix-turn-helix transcriptional regulator [Streptomyces sp. NPDC004658]|uniref:helix-turn-helix domain-containing protein n=1 Tax=Streptomyces sp. NPDC004658 TaxID=3154672 RepID=UPI0033A69A0E
MRAARGLSLRELAARLASAGHSLSADAINKIENGREAGDERQVRRVDVDDLHALAAALNVRPEQLWAGPADCLTCHGKPPTGFICATCGTGPGSAG